MTRQAIDLQKIQSLESWYQGWFNFKASLIAGVIIGTLIFLATMQYEKILPSYAIGVGDLVVMVFGLIAIRDMKQNHERHISFINDLIQKLEQGEKLGSIDELRHQHKSQHQKASNKS